MKRSEINREIRYAEQVFAKYHFVLPQFANWSPEEWKAQQGIQEILDCELGWDVTDFGRGDFLREGLFLFTIRNGKLGSAHYPKQYAEKIMLLHPGQRCINHCHECKREDIINRGGGKLAFQLYNRKGKPGDKPALDDTPVHIMRDGQELVLPAGQELVIGTGESITLTPNLFHTFYPATDEDVMIGEVSSVNDDHTDNTFLEQVGRFPEIEEDEPVYRYLVCDYAKYLR